MGTQEDPVRGVERGTEEDASDVLAPCSAVGKGSPGFSL